MFHPMLRRQAATAGAVLTVGGIALFPRGNVYAESPSDSLRRRKPIYDYDDDVLPPKAAEKQPEQEPLVPTPEGHTVPATPLPPTEASAPTPAPVPARSATTYPSAPTPTDQLAAQVRQARLFIYTHSLRAETAFNDALSRVMNAESRFTSTVASLAPARESGERLLPGSVYVLVAAMAGSIVSRNRGVLLRASTPLAFGTVAAYSLLPVTMRNVGDLVWEYEKRVPAVAEQHIRVRAAAEESWARALAHSGYGRDWMESKIGSGRETVHDWLKKGR